MKLTHLPLRGHWSRVGFVITCFALLGVLVANAGAQSSPSVPRLILTAPQLACTEPRYLGWQLSRYSDMRSLMNQASENILPTGSVPPPTYSTISNGWPNPVYEPVTYARAIPNIILRGLPWQESHWLQFADTVADWDERNAYTLKGGCGYGVMQVDYCMQNPSQCPWLSAQHVSDNLVYNLGAGTDWLIRSWNSSSVPYIGWNDHTRSQDWYYAIAAYNSWDEINSPNTPTATGRPPYGDQPPDPLAEYTYEEKVLGFVAHPELAVPPGVVQRRLWRSTRVAEVPRGIWGLGGTWLPPSHTPDPVFTLLPNISVTAQGAGPHIRLTNTADDTLAADVALYNPDDTFNRRWLYPSSPYIRIAPQTTVDLAVANAFPGQSFVGYARVTASMGVDVVLDIQPAYHAYLPNVSNTGGASAKGLEVNGESGCGPILENSSFELFQNGKPQGWDNLSQDEYSLADGTWFRNGHYAAHLGGYDDPDANNQLPNDYLRQTKTIGSNYTSAFWEFWWYMHTEETVPQVYDYLYARVRDSNYNILYQVDITNMATRDTWVHQSIDILHSVPNPTGRPLKFSFESSLDYSYPTTFFIDDAQVTVCW